SVIAAVLLKRVAHFRPNLRRARDACALIIAAGIIAPAAGALIGAGAFALAGSTPSGVFAHEWLVWFLGDAMGAIVFALAVLVWASGSLTDGPRPQPNVARPRETAAFVIALAISSIVALGANAT